MERPTTLTARERQEESDRFTQTLAGLAVTVFLAVVSLWVAERLAEVSKLEDCLLQGRMNCERVDFPPTP
jgi:hypothetical protein